MEGTEGYGEGGPGWPLADGTRLGKYRIVRFLGEGGMGAVYEALHLEMGKRVAIKTISPALAANPEARARFLLEAQLTSRVRHPHTVDVTDISMEGEQAFLVMEYLEGEDLAKHIRHQAPLAVEEVIDIALPILAAVAAAHEEGIVHRDLKPQNIFLAEMRDGTVCPKVLDFGISKAPSNPIRTSGVILGSPSYFAPEQVQDSKAISPASDQYALGVILYECVTGVLPYEGSNLAAIFQAIVTGHYPPPSRYRSDLPEGLQRVIATAMSLTPRTRFPTVKAMGRALLELASPKTRMVWEVPFAAPDVPVEVPPIAGPPSPVPVTDQMPGSIQAGTSVTMAMPGIQEPQSSPENRSARWALPTPSPSPETPDLALVVPRRYGAARWAVGGAVIAAVCAAAVFAFQRRSVTPLPAAPALPSSSSTMAVPRPGPAAPEDEPAGAVGEEAASSGAIEPPPSKPPDKSERRGRAAPRPRFGPNRAPLIE